MDDFEKMGVTPELTQAMRDLSTVNTGIILLKKLHDAGMSIPESDELAERLEKELVPSLVLQLNELIKREEILKKGITGDE